MKREAVESSNVAEVGYDPNTLRLEVQFLNGGVYHYRGVSPAVHQEMMAAESKGKFLAARIRGKYQCEETVALTSLTPSPGFGRGGVMQD